MAATAQSAAGGHQLRSQLKADFANTSFQGEMVIVPSDFLLSWRLKVRLCAGSTAVAEISGGYSVAATASWHLELAVFHCCWRSPGGVFGLRGASVDHRSSCSSNGAALLWSVLYPLV